MKVLCLDHGAVLRGYRGRYVALAGLAPDLELTVVAPRSLREGNYQGQWDASDASENGYQLRFATYRPAKAHRGLYGPLLLARLIREFRPDIIHTQGEPEALSSAEICLLRDTFSSRSAVVFVSWSNIDVYRMGWTYRMGKLYDWCYRLVLKRAYAATVYCADAARILRGNGFQGPIAHIPWGVDPVVFRRVASGRLREELGLRGLVLGFVGRLERPKGVATLIRAAAKSGVECTLLMLGDGPALAEWRELATTLDVSVRWIGSVNGSALPSFLSCMDALVLPSETTKYWREQFGKVLIEAMSCEVPVIGSDSGEIPTVIGDAGLVFREKDPDDLAAKIVSLASETARVEWARKGRARVLQEYSWEVVARRTIGFYRDLARLRRG